MSEPILIAIFVVVMLNCLQVECLNGPELLSRKRDKEGTSIYEHDIRRQSDLFEALVYGWTQWCVLHAAFHAQLTTAHSLAPHSPKVWPVNVLKPP